MRAVRRRAYGETDVLTIEDVDIPTPAADQVLVRVKAAGVNMAEWHLMTGRPSLVKVALGFPRPRNASLGADLAGVVEAVGPGATRFAVGDEVFGAGDGTFAEYAVATQERLQPKPATVSFEEAAAMPMAGYTALQALAVAGDLAGKQVAVTGAGGGVGSMLVQLAKARGAHVTAICSARKAEFVLRLGATEAIDYATTDVTAGQRRFTAVFDFAGGRPLRSWRRVIHPGGVLVLGGDEGGGAVLGPLGRSFRSLFVRGIRIVTLLASTTPESLDELRGSLESGELRSPLTRSYPLDDVAQAIDDLRAAKHPGKLVLVP
ncbi:NAD(P)-dependent alcohol dehydrogenase [Pseudolysinimonas sp.]|jgi:NADPH:quinone reductase-like Zn-dependent oxidoreductase|uniref:NAD(P)-dependent alcohol dehydrogenase n=1 Tax=Pseudolysinimonas sp. TaxID=2680009 RepID=UPI00378310A8